MDNNSIIILLIAFGMAVGLALLALLAVDELRRHEKWRASFKRPPLPKEPVQTSMKGAEIDECAKRWGIYRRHSESDEDLLSRITFETRPVAEAASERAKTEEALIELLVISIRRNPNNWYRSGTKSGHALIYGGRDCSIHIELTNEQAGTVKPSLLINGEAISLAGEVRLLPVVNEWFDSLVADKFNNAKQALGRITNVDEEKPNTEQIGDAPICGDPY